MILLPPQRLSTLPHQLSLTSTRILGNHLSMANDRTTRSAHFASKSVENPFLATITAPRLFPQNILNTKVYRTSSISPIAVVITRYKEGQEILTKPFCSPILGSASAAKQNVCKSACDYITRNFMDEVKQLDGDTVSSNNASDGDQYNDEDRDDVNMEVPSHVVGVPAGGPTYAIQEELFDSDEPTNSTVNQNDITLLSEPLAIPTEDRKRQYDEDLTNEVVKASDNRFNNVERSPIFSKIPKTN